MKKLAILGYLAMGFMLLLTLSVAINILLLKYKVDVTQLMVDDDWIQINEEAKRKLDNIYVNPFTVEIPACLGGKVENEKIVVYSVEEAKIIKTNSSSVQYIQCPLYTGSYKTIGTIHNHPDGECDLSPMDATTYTNDFRRGQSVIGLYCGKYYFFSLIRGELNG